MTPEKFDGDERRKARRRPILDSFSLFAVIPAIGDHRLEVQDISELGMGIVVDSSQIPPERVEKMNLNQQIEVDLYLNQSLYLPLEVKILRLGGDEKNEAIYRVGGEFCDRTSKTYQAFHNFLKALDDLVEAARFQ